YEAKIAALRAELDRANTASSTAFRSAALERFEALTEELTQILEARSSILVQLDDYVYTAARQRIGRMLEQSRRLLLYFGALALAVGAATALYLRSMARAIGALAAPQPPGRARGSTDRRTLRRQ
ncbi:MAG: hypothetical protein Q8M76_15020, partial [Spirochaetaceae bacterium]|nr:hypothetical protein [Spirochaetaceae bacterium]